MVKDISDFQVCKAQQKWWNKRDDDFAYIILSRETGLPEKVCSRAMERAEKRGYLEYGVSLRTAWITQKGLKLLEKC